MRRHEDAVDEYNGNNIYTGSHHYMHLGMDTVVYERSLT